MRFALFAGAVMLTGWNREANERGAKNADGIAPVLQELRHARRRLGRVGAGVFYIPECRSDHAGGRCDRLRNEVP